MDSHYEHLSIRGFPEARIRKSTLKPFVEGWETPTPEEVRNVMKMAGLTGKTASELVGLSNTRTVRRWIGGDREIPYASWALLCDKAGLGVIWK
ncbi:MAG: KorC repressor protein [Hahellaceae bacterium]|jgi:hypothetical protein|nr:KorC repressor protein [Hahellaceae bacterium]